jgi:hypothetical protein
MHLVGLAREGPAIRSLRLATSGSRLEVATSASSVSSSKLR